MITKNIKLYSVFNKLIDICSWGFSISGLTFYFFELLKSGLILRFDLLRTQATHEESYSLSVSGKLLAGGAAGAMAQSVCYPLDVARFE